MSTIKTRPRPDVSPIRRLTDDFPADTRITVADVTWEDYERFSDATREGGNIRIAFDGRDIEIMVTGPLHETFKERLAAFISIVAAELGIERQPLGQTTWKRPELSRGLESDLCYYFDQTKITLHAQAVGRGSNGVDDYPNPDLAIEVDLSTSKIDRPGIYAALQVSEIWRFHDKSVSIQQLDASGTYTVVDSSRFLHIRAEEIARWLIREESRGRVTWERRLRTWVQNELVSRVNLRNSSASQPSSPDS